MASCQIDRSEAQRLAATGAHLVDVLPRRPFREPHIAGALNVPPASWTARQADWAASARGLPSGAAFQAEPEELAEHVMDPAPTTVRPSLLLDAAAERFGAGVDSLLVTTSDGAARSG